jgi:hypothetical protein
MRREACLGLSDGPFLLNRYGSVGLPEDDCFLGLRDAVLGLGLDGMADGLVRIPVGGGLWDQEENEISLTSKTTTRFVGHRGEDGPCCKDVGWRVLLRSKCLYSVS